MVEVRSFFGGNKNSIKIDGFLVESPIGFYQSGIASEGETGLRISSNEVRHVDTDRAATKISPNDTPIDRNRVHHKKTKEQEGIRVEGDARDLRILLNGVCENNGLDVIVSGDEDNGWGEPSNGSTEQNHAWSNGFNGVPEAGSTSTVRGPAA